MENLNIYFYSLNKDMKPKEPDCLHCIVRVTGEVGGDHQQIWRTEAGQQDHQVDLEPQLIVTGLEDREFGSQSRQSQVQYCVPDVRVGDVGDVFLRAEGGGRDTFSTTLGPSSTACLFASSAFLVQAIKDEF